MSYQVVRRVNRFADIAVEVRNRGKRIPEFVVKGGVIYMKAIMPEKTGAMKRSTEPVELANGWAIRIGVSYWRYVNDGTIYIEGQHFREETWEFMKADFEKQMRNIFKPSTVGF